jgi:hypothetical protein
MVMGVETAGLVLAVLPLIIQALSEYGTGLEKTAFILGRRQNVQKYKNKIGKLVRRLSSLRTHFKQNLAKVVGRAAPGDWCGDLPEDYKSDFWTGAMKAKLEAYLRSAGAFESFEDVVHDIEDYLEDITRNLVDVLKPREVRQNLL